MADIIKPFELPDGAGVEYSNGDVKHVSPDDPLTSESIAQATRNLAHRDNLIKAKVDEVVAVVNNREQLVNVPIMRTVIPPTTVETVCNYRIPVGFEARVLNATVSSSNNKTRLMILWNSTFGGTAGAEVVNTVSEAQVGTEFFGAGEFIVQLNNTDSLTADVVASAMVTIRPIGITAGGLIGPGTIGPTGLTGPRGLTGADGGVGPTGAAGVAGLLWRGLWSSGASYVKNDAVRFQFSGTSGYSSYIALGTNSNVAPPDPLVGISASWELLAESGTVAAAGPVGPTGPKGINVRGGWSSTGTYAKDDLVVRSQVTDSGTFNRTYVATGTPTVAVAPETSGPWLELFSSAGTGVTVSDHTVSGTYTTSGAGFAFGANTFPYVGTPTLSAGSGALAFRETVTENINASDTLRGMAFLSQIVTLIFTGTVKVRLPRVADDARINWTANDVNCVATSNGTLAGNLVEVWPTAPARVNSDGYYLKVAAPAPQKTTIVFTGWGVF